MLHCPLMLNIGIAGLSKTYSHRFYFTQSNLLSVRHLGWVMGLKLQQPKIVSYMMCLSTQVTFEDVIAEPASVSSFDKVWLWSHALFEVSRLWFYRIISLLLAVPVALVAGVLFAVLSCLHIWWVTSEWTINYNKAKMWHLSA